MEPDVVLGTGYEIETPYGFDQADHRAAGLATLDAVRDAVNRWVFQEQIDDEGLALHSVRRLIVPGLDGSGATHGVEVTGEPLRRGRRLARGARRIPGRAPGPPRPRGLHPASTAMSGKAMGVEHAVLFRAHDLQAPPEFETEQVRDRRPAE
ncbi:hypothetical protein [Streptomyces sp. NPDC048419]|uniref:hypothetical protein n=1 Tax=Streptomyces sp. NPDC048419 TaxID=3365547 RepID=UPI003720BADB